MTTPITLFFLASGLAVGVLVAVAQAPSPLAAESVDRCAQQAVAVQDGEVPTPTAVRAQIVLLKQTLWRAGYHEAYRAGVQLLQQPEFEDGQSLHDVVALLGRPDLIFATTSGGADLYYNTNGGPLNFGFQRCALIHKSMDTPAHWRNSAVPQNLVPGQFMGHAFLECDKGRSIRIQFVTGPGGTHGWGIGEDNRENLYTFVF